MTDIAGVFGGAVVFLFVAGQLAPVPIGTAFLVGYPVPGRADQVVPLVVTARHVIADHPKILARFNTASGTSTAMAEYDVGVLKGAGDYWAHPDPGVDIVAFRTPHFAATRYVPVPLALIASRETYDDAQVQATDRVMFPGLLVNFMGLSQNYPVVRSGSIALGPGEKVPMEYRVGKEKIVTRQEVLLIDGTAVPGASGSPVFLWPGPRPVGNSFNLGTKPLLLGVLHGFYPAAPREIQVVETAAVPVFSENSNIAIVFPAWRLREIFDLPEFQRRVAALAASLGQ